MPNLQLFAFYLGADRRKSLVLVSFTVKNFRSFREEQTLSFVADTRLKDHAEHRTPLPGRHKGHLLPLALMYGANGSGKSNLIRALARMRSVVLDGPTDRNSKTNHSGYEPYLLDDESRNKPTEFTARFLIETRLFEYGFVEDSTGFLSEWLFELLSEAEDRAIFERTDSEITFGADLMERKIFEKISALTIVGIKRNQSLIFALSDQFERDALPDFLASVAEFFEAITIILPNTQAESFATDLAYSKGFSQTVSRVVRAADTGVHSISVETESIDHPDAIRTLEELTSGLTEGHRSGASVSLDYPDGPGWFRRSDSGGWSTNRPVTMHECSDRALRPLDFSEESDGTQRLAHLAPALNMVGAGRIVVIDEMERSLHPLLARNYLEQLVKGLQRSGAQALISTHESYLLTQSILRRDEVWLVEKSADQETHLRSLSEYDVRKDLRLQKGYLAGRFGAIPILRDLDFTECIEDEAPSS